MYKSRKRYRLYMKKYRRCNYGLNIPNRSYVWKRHDKHKNDKIVHFSGKKYRFHMQRLKKNKGGELMYKVETDTLLKTLSVISDETANKKNDILADLSEFQLMIDEKLIPAIELVQYENKYELIDEIKKECNKIAFYLHFSELIGKTVIGIDSVSLNISKEIYKVLLKKYLDDEMRSNSLWNLILQKQEKVAISEYVPTIISSIKETPIINVLNIAENTVSISNKQYIDLLTYSTTENLDLASLVHGISVPGNIENDRAVILLPENIDLTKKYYQAYCNALDVLIIEQKNCTIEKIENYKNVKSIYIIGKSSDADSEQRNILVDYASANNITLYFEKKISTAIQRSLFYSYEQKNNFCYLTIISNLLYENTWYLANRYNELKLPIQMINEDLLFKSKETGKYLKEMQIKYRDESVELEKVYMEYKKIIDLLMEKLISIQEKMGVQENTILANGKYCINNHLDTNQIWMDLIVKMIDTFKSFPEQNHKDIIRKQCSIYESISEQDDISTIFMGILTEKNSVSKQKINQFVTTKYSSMFVTRFIIKYSEELSISVEQLGSEVCQIKGNLSAKEELAIGKYKLNHSDRNFAKKYLIAAAIHGNESASNLLNKEFILSIEELKMLAEHGVTVAAYELARKIMNDSADVSNNFYWEDGLKYLHIAAAKNNLKAIKMLGDIWFDEFYDGDSEEENSAEYALYYYLLAEKNGSNDKKMFERIGTLSFELDKYRDAMEYFLKSETSEANYYLGLMYEQGNNCAADENKALKYYEIAMNAGHSEAAVQYERLNAQIEAKKQKTVVTENTSYSSYTYYSSYYSYYSGW